MLIGTTNDFTTNGIDFWLLKLSPLAPDKTDEYGKLVLYPNPTAKDVKLKTTEYFLPNSTVKVIDVLGRNVFNGVIGKNCQEFEVELPASLSIGMYFLQIESIKNCTLPFVKGVVIEELYPLSIFNYFHNKMLKILKGYFKFSKTKIAD